MTIMKAGKYIIADPQDHLSYGDFLDAKSILHERSMSAKLDPISVSGVDILISVAGVDAARLVSECGKEMTIRSGYIALIPVSICFKSPPKYEFITVDFKDDFECKSGDFLFDFGGVLIDTDVEDMY